MRRFCVTVTLLAAALLTPFTVPSQTPQKDQEAQAKARREEFKKKARTLVPSKAERAPYADFLKQRNTGLIRLLPRDACQPGM